MMLTYKTPLSTLAMVGLWRVLRYLPPCTLNLQKATAQFREMRDLAPMIICERMGASPHRQRPQF